MDDRKFTLVTDKLDSKYEKPSGIKFPKALYEDEYFRGISAEAKVVYCVMLDLTQEARKKRCVLKWGIYSMRTVPIVLKYHQRKVTRNWISMCLMMIEGYACGYRKGKIAMSVVIT